MLGLGRVRSGRVELGQVRHTGLDQTGVRSQVGVCRRGSGARVRCAIDDF